MTTDNHDIEYKVNGNKFKFETDLDRQAHYGLSWPLLLKEDRDAMKLYGLSEDDILEMAAANLVERLQNNPVEVMKLLGAKAKIATLNDR